MTPTLDELTVASPPGPWERAGFRLEHSATLVGAVRLVFAGSEAGRGLVGWSLSGLASGSLDGLPPSDTASPTAPMQEEHPNGVLAIDHLVAFSPNLDRTQEALRMAGFDFRRMREGPTPGGSTRQAFFRIGEPVLEVIEAPEGSRIASDPDGPARLWGVAFLVDDFDRVAAALGGQLGEPRDAVQPGRRIATARREAGLGPAVAFMTPA